MSYSFDRRKLCASDFQISKFLQDYQKRARGKSLSLDYESLHGELVRYTGDLQDELYRVIQRDYAEFIRLSRQLTGVVKLVGELRSDMDEMKGKIEGVRGQMMSHLMEIEARLSQLKLDRDREDLSYISEEVQSIHAIMMQEKNEEALMR
jgi:hypothetical protein